MFGPPRPFLSPLAGTVRTLTFFRNIPAQDPITKEERANLWPFYQGLVDVQAWALAKVLATRLQETYAQVYDLVLSGLPDIRHNDRTVIDGAECVIISVTPPWGGHREAVAAARQPSAG